MEADMSRIPYDKDSYDKQKQLLLELDERLPKLARLTTYGDHKAYAEYLESIAVMKIQLFRLVEMIQESGEAFEEEHSDEVE